MDIQDTAAELISRALLCVFLAKDGQVCAIIINDKVDALSVERCTVAGEKRNPTAFALWMRSLIVHITALIIGSDSVKVRFADVHHFHSVFLLVMEGRPWYNGRALVRGSSGLLLPVWSLREVRRIIFKQYAV